MKQNLDEFIRENRAAFDTREPSANAWRRVQHAMFEKQGSALMYWRAAAILLMGLSAFLLYSRWNETRDNRIVMNEFKDIESFYVREIADKIDLIENVAGEEMGLNGYTHDFRQLEAMYEVLKDEMRVRPSKKVKDALILNLLIRIDLLNKQLDKLDHEEDAAEDSGTRSDVSL